MTEPTPMHRTNAAATATDEAIIFVLLLPVRSSALHRNDFRYHMCDMSG